MKSKVNSKKHWEKNKMKKRLGSKLKSFSLLIKMEMQTLLLMKSSLLFKNKWHLSSIISIKQVMEKMSCMKLRDALKRNHDKYKNEKTESKIKLKNYQIK